MISLCLSYQFRSLYALALLIFGLGILYANGRSYLDFKNDQLPQYYGKETQYTGFVSNFPDIREKSNRVIIQITQINEIKAENLGKLLLIYPSEQSLDYGDLITMKAKSKKPKYFQGFNYPQYLKRFGVQTIIRSKQNITVVSPKTHGNYFIKTAKSVRNYLAKNLESSLPKPHNQIAMGILLGVKKELPEKSSQDFKNSGLQHILVVSGFNVTILIVFVALLLRQFGRRIIFLGSLVSLFFFTLMVGADPPVLRAAVFGGICGWAIVSGQFSDSRNLLFLTAVILALWNPMMIQTDVSFFLSFFATFGIIVGLPVILPFFDFITDRFELRTIISVIVVAQISVFPILGLTFGTFPFVGFFANIFVEPLIPIAMFFSGIVSILPSFLGNWIHLISVPAYLVLEIILQIAHFFGQFPPMPINKTLAQITLFGVLGFFFWTSFSLVYQQTFLERPE